jgi:hypothetical protein
LRRIGPAKIVSGSGGAWQVHATAWQLYLHAREDKPAEANRERAEACILKIANSFARDEPLRASFLSAPSIARVLGASEKQESGLLRILETEDCGRN